MKAWILLIMMLVGCAQTDDSGDDQPGPADSPQQPAYSVVAENVAYHDGTTGYFARPVQAGNYPGVVMIHEWWGLNDNIRNMAEELAAEGYNVIAVDLHKGMVAETPDQARELVFALDQDEALANMRSAKQFLLSRGSEKIASLGWCFGGGQSLQLALNEQLDATVIYYGNLVTDPFILQDINWPVLGVFGAEDQSIPVSSVREFESALDQAGITNEIYIYDGVGHAFANPSNPGHDPAKTADAWQKTVAFLDEKLK